MSKLVVKIKDDDKRFSHCPLQHEGYCHLPQTHYWSGNALYMQQCLGILNKRPPWCPLKEEKKAISIDAVPIDWLKRWEEKHKNDPCYCNFVTDEILADWEKENEKSGISG